MKGARVARNSCLICTKKVSKSALDSVTCCSKCAANLKANFINLLTRESDLSRISGQTGLPELVLKELMQRAGIYDAAWIAANAPTLVSLREVSLLGVSENYDRAGKNKDRTYIFEAVRKLLKDRPVAMLTMPHVAMICYVDTAANLSLAPGRSALVERETAYFNILNSWKANWQSFSDGEILRDVLIFKGTISRALQQLPKVYNFVNLDFLGPWTEEVERTVRRLFHYQRLEDESIVSITLSEAKRWVGNPQPQYGLVDRPHRDFVIEKFKELAKKTGYSPIYLWHHTYSKNTSYPMITIVFRVRKKAS